MFLQACVILFTGGVSASVHAGIAHTPQADIPPEQTPPRSRHPPGADTHPLGADTPPEADTPPRSRHPPGSRHPPWEQTPPLGADTPPPPAEHAGRYGQRAGGTHPTGMQSCIMWTFSHCNLSPYFGITLKWRYRYCKVHSYGQQKW